MRLGTFLLDNPIRAYIPRRESFTVVNPVHFIPARRKVKCNPSGIKDTNFTSSSTLPTVVDDASTMTSLPRFASASYLVKKGGTNLFGTLPVRLCGNFVSGWKQVVGYQRSFDVYPSYAYRESWKATKGTCELARRIRRGSKREKALSVKASTLATAARHNCHGGLYGTTGTFFHINCIYYPIHRLPAISVESNTELLPLSQATMVDKKQKEPSWTTVEFSCVCAQIKI